MFESINPKVAAEAAAKRLQQKVGMMGAIMGPLSIANGVRGSAEYETTLGLVDAAQIALRLGETTKARELIDRSVEEMWNCVKLLPKTPRKLVAANLKKIAKY